MVAITARFITPRKPVAVAAFGGLIDLGRIFFQHGRSMPVVCSECQTINRFSAKVCKGCDGKLPAFYTAAGSGDAPSSGAAGARALAWVARAARAFSVPARWRTVVSAGIALITLFGAFALWYAMYSSAAGRPVQAAPPALPAAAAPGAPAIAAPPVAAPAPVADALNLAAPPAGGLVDEAAEAPRQVRAPLEARPDPQRAVAPPPAQPRAAPVRQAGASPLAMCRGLNFFAHAVCVNNTCAQPGSARHPQCAQALRQRRVDEARRNPTLFN